MKRNNLLKLIVAAVLSLCMVFVFIGCGNSSDDQTTEEKTSAESTEATEAESSEEYDISQDITVQEVDENVVLYANGFELTMPNTGTWTYDAETKDSVRIYYMPADDAGYGGTLVTIMAMDMDDTSYEEFPSYSVAGESSTFNKRFIAMFPTDVQYDPNDETQGEEYMELFNYVQKINGTSAASPLMCK